MIQLTPVRNICLVGEDIWFVARGINALFRYDSLYKKIELVPMSGNIEEDFSFLSTYYFNNKIYLPPVYKKGFLSYDLKSGLFRQILTPNSQGDHNFGYSFLDGNIIVCAPDVIDGGFVFFDMKQEKEVRSPIFFPEKFRRKELVPMVTQKISSNLYYGLLYPQNIIFSLNILTEEFVFCSNNAINEVINSFYVKGDFIFISASGKLYITDLKMNILKIETNICDDMYFIGELDGFVFGDIKGKSIKKMLDYNGKEFICKEFDEKIYGWNDDNSFNGIIYMDKEKGKNIYFSSGCHGVFEFENGECIFKKMELTNKASLNIIENFNQSIHSGNVIKENLVFGLDSFLEGVK